MLRVNSFEILEYFIDSETVLASHIEIPTVISKATGKGIN
jgi:hypothetical protein